MLEDENTQLKENLRRSDPSQSPLRGKGGITPLESMQRIWLEEKKALQLETEHLKERLKLAEEQSTRDVGLIATLEERLKESTSNGATDLDDLGAEDLNDEINTSRKDL
jgi:hypothetical protein